MTPSGTLFYLREINARLDSGMTLQVIHDYGYLSRHGYNVIVPVIYDAETEKTALQQYIESNNLSNLNPVFINSGHLLLRYNILLKLYLAVVAFLALMPSNNSFIVLREHKYSSIGKLLKKLAGAKLISEFHESSVLLKDHGKATTYFNQKCNKLDGLIFTNASQLLYLKSIGIDIQQNHIIMPNGIDFHTFAQARPNRDESVKYITYTGQFTSWKNIPLLFAALSKLDVSYRLRIAGGKIHGNSAKYIDELAGQFGVTGRVDYIGFIHPKDLVSQAINNSDVLAVPLGDNVIAQYATSPMKLVEYMATPIAVVAVVAPSITSLAGRDTVHLSTQDPDDFARAITFAVNENAPDKAERIARTNQLAQQFDHTVRAGNYHTWLGSLASDTTP